MFIEGYEIKTADTVEDIVKVFTNYWCGSLRPSQENVDSIKKVANAVYHLKEKQNSLCEKKWRDISVVFPNGQEHQCDSLENIKKIDAIPTPDGEKVVLVSSYWFNVFMPKSVLNHEGAFKGTWEVVADPKNYHLRYWGVKGIDYKSLGFVAVKSSHILYKTIWMAPHHMEFVRDALPMINYVRELREDIDEYDSCD